MKEKTAVKSFLFIGFFVGAYAGIVTIMFLVAPLLLGNQEVRSIFLFFTTASSKLIILSSLIILLFTVMGVLVAYTLVTRNLLKEKIRQVSAVLESNRSKDEFISMVLHHLRTPLSGIRWSLKEILKDFSGTEAEKEDIKRLDDENTRALNAVGHLIEASHASLESLVYTEEIITVSELNSLIVNNTELFRAQAKGKDISLEIATPTPSESSVRVDKGKIVTIVQTLIENAITYTPKGGSVHVRTEEKDLDFLFHIKDTGIGIPKKDKDRVFTQFFRTAQARTQEPAGFGIGIFLVKIFLTHLKGDIWFVSEEGKGTTFSFKLPIITAATEKILGKV